MCIELKAHFSSSISMWLKWWELHAFIFMIFMSQWNVTICPYMAATTQQHPEGDSSSHSGTELCRHSSSPHTPPPPPPPTPPAPPPPPPPSPPTATRRSEDTTDVGAGAVAGREHDTSTHVHTTEVLSYKVNGSTSISYSVATMYI